MSLAQRAKDAEVVTCCATFRVATPTQAEDINKGVEDDAIQKGETFLVG